MGPVYQALGVEDLDELFREVGFGKIAARQVVNILKPEEAVTEEKRDESILKKVARKIVPKKEKGVKIKGVDDIMIHYSKCCNPVPGDKIVGFITHGRGVSIHTADCPNFYDLAGDRERIISVEWDIEHATTHSARISVLTVDKPGMLANVSTAIASAEANISHADISTTEDKRALCNFVVEITDTKHLDRVMKRVAQVNGVINVKRVKAA
jgi:GTP diphosphokinase / guanosine-3',5'-bis(diphosphate) 3'-diphosphatase